jgi:hypothetical protein
MALMADTRIAFVAPGGAGQDASLPPAAGDVLQGFDPARPPWVGRRTKRAGGVMASRALLPRRSPSIAWAATACEIDLGPAP